MIIAIQKRIIQILLFIVLANLNAQENLPLRFEEDVIKWSELSWMEGQPSNDQWVHMACPPQIKDDTIYLFMNYYQKEFEDNRNYGYCGYIIKKLNLTTGEKYWETSRIYKEHGDRKILSWPTFKDKEIEVALYDESHAIGPNTDWHECYPAHITIDRESGIIVDSNFVNKLNPELPRLRSFGNIFFSGSTRPTIFKNVDSYLHIRRGLGLLERSSLTFEGEIIHKDSIFYPDNFYTPWSILFEKVEKDSFWLIIFSRNSDWSGIQVLFSKYDKDFNISETFDVTEHFDYSIDAGGIYFIDRGYFVVETNFTNFVDTTLKFQSYLFDDNGTFVDSISYTLRPGIDDIIVYGWLRPLVDRVNNRMIMTQSRQNSPIVGTYFEMYENSGDTISRINRIHVEGITDHFRNFYSTMLDNGDVLMYIEQFTDPGPSGDRWFSWIMLDGQKLYNTSNTEEIYTEEFRNKLKLYPNPTTGMVHIENLNQPANVRIYKITGELMQYRENITDQINIDALPAGLYIFDIYDDDSISERHKIIKIE
jgi:hypothetical protein